jgi:hypothetical protein
MTKGPLASYGPEIVDMIGKTWFFKLPLESNGKNILGLVWFMVFNATFTNFSVVSWQSVLLVEETGGPRIVLHDTLLPFSLNGPKSNDSLSYTLNDIKIKVKKLGLCKPFSYPAL